MNNTSTENQTINSTDKDYLFELMKLGWVNVAENKVQLQSKREEQVPGVSALNFQSLVSKGVKMPVTWSIESITANDKDCIINFTINR